MVTKLPLEHVHIEPEEQTPSPPWTMLLHGRGADEQDLLGLTRILPPTMHVISVRAPRPLGPGYTWYELDISGGDLHTSQPANADFDESLALVADMIDAAAERYNLDPDKLGLLGFSQGAILALGALVEHPYTPQWIVSLHGYLPERYTNADLEQASRTPVFIGAGTQDDIIPAARGADAAARISCAGVNVTQREYDTGHGIGPNEMEDVEKWIHQRLDE